EKPFRVEDLLNKVALAVYRSRDAERPTHPTPIPSTDPPPARVDRGVVLVVEHDRARLQQLDVSLSARGYTVVSMTRALVQISRLARALRPRAILLELDAEGARDAARELVELSSPIPILVYARDGRSGVHLAHASDADLVAFVESR